MTTSDGTGGLLHRVDDVVAAVTRWFEEWSASERRPAEARGRKPSTAPEPEGTAVEGDSHPNPIKHWRWS